MEYVNKMKVILTAISEAGLPGDGRGWGLPNGDVCCRPPYGTPTLIPVNNEEHY
jgi:hypothetical protein